ncbi:MAG TPA: ABC transporter ATP-binding protein [Acidimicrobiales bacterium]|nr:ABC transporter ATP-binding protein [Acidimicrobiales bacterium]
MAERTAALADPGPVDVTSLGSRPPAAPPPLLDVRAVAVSFGGVRAVEEATLAVPEGAFASLIGPNGAGKTTLLHAVSGFCRPSGGEIRFAGERIDGHPPHAVAGRGIVRTFQRGRVFPRLTCLDNVRLGGKDHPGERFVANLARRGARRRREAELTAQARELLGDVGLEAKAGELAGTLSGGQRKLLEFARALMCEPRLVLLDEPMAGVNPTTGRHLMERIAALHERRGLTVLFVEHQLDVVMEMSDLVVVMAGGRVIRSGRPDEVRADRGVQDAYLGAWEATRPGRAGAAVDGGTEGRGPEGRSPERHGEESRQRQAGGEPGPVEPPRPGERDGR